MNKNFRSLENIIKDMRSSVPMLNDTDWKYSRICTTIRSVYENEKTRQEHDKKPFNKDDQRLADKSTEQDEVEMRRFIKTQQKKKLIEKEEEDV